MSDPEPAGLHDLACAVHLHSDYSDGTATIPELMEAGRAAGRDVDPPHRPRHPGRQGRRARGLARLGPPGRRPRGDAARRATTWPSASTRRSSTRACPRRTSPMPSPRRAASGSSPTRGRRARASSSATGASSSAGGPTAGTSSTWTTVAGIELWSLTTDASEDWRGPVDAIRYMRDPEAQLDGPRPEDLVAWDRICEKQPLRRHRRPRRAPARHPRARPTCGARCETPATSRSSRPTSR